MMYKKTKGEIVAAPTITKPAIAEQFENFIRNGRILFLSAPCGFGKTTLTDALLKGQRGCKALWLNAGTDDISRIFAGNDVPAGDRKTRKACDKEADWDILVIDDLQMVQEESDWQMLCDLICSHADRRFILLSRGTPPGSLMAFRYTGLMTVLQAEDLLFDCDDIRKALNAYGVTVTDSELHAIQKGSIGYPLGVMIVVRHMSGGKPFSSAIAAQALREVFLYFEDAVYRRFDLPVRRFLLELAPFENFDLEMARVVTGDPHAGKLLDWLLSNTTMLRYDDMQHFSFWPEFRDFLLWKMEQEYSEEKRRTLLGRGGLYYELKEDYAHALECYTKGGDHSKVSELLVRNAELHPGMGHYHEMEKYYRSLPESEIEASPSLMQGMSMLCALAMDFEGSERWYSSLQAFSRRCGKQDAAGKQARGRLAWLDISLPQRGVENLTTIIPAVFRMLTNKELVLPPFSVTSALPSIMNGGKDFSIWSKKDDLLYKTLRIPVEAILRKDGVCLADCAIAESKFEKGVDVSVRILSLVPLMSEIRQSGTPDMEFAVAGLIARSQLASGQCEEGCRTIQSLRKRFEEVGQTRFLPNMDAMLCRFALLSGDLESADEWYREKAPRDPIHLNVMKRYQYFTQAMTELADGRPDAALMTIAPLEPYCKSCAKHIDGIHLHVLKAIALYRKKDEAWKEALEEALAAAEEFRFIRTISIYGTAVLPLLEEQSTERIQECEHSSKWYRKLVSEVRTQAAFYPHFLEPRLAPSNTLTPMELQILHLICADKSNAEIGQIMDIKLPTVKTHVSHILSKLDVKRRSEAKTAAKKLRLVPESI